MNPSTDSPWTDPKLWIAILAIGIAVASFVFSWWSRIDQNKKWDALNVARLDVTNLFFIGWTEIEAEKVKSIDWGYTPYWISHLEGRVHTSKGILLDKLVLWDNVANSKIKGSGSFLTVIECLAKARDLGLDEAKFSIRKHMKLHFDIHNSGSTVTKNVKVDVSKINSITNNAQEIFNSKSRLDMLNPDQKAGINIDFFIPIEASLQNPTLLQINLSFLTAEDKPIKRIIKIDYDPNIDMWSYGRK